MARLTNSQDKSHWSIYVITILGILILTLLMLVSVSDKNKVLIRKGALASADKGIVLVTYEWGSDEDYQIIRLSDD